MDLHDMHLRHVSGNPYHVWCLFPLILNSWTQCGPSCWSEMWTACGAVLDGMRGVLCVAWIPDQLRQVLCVVQVPKWVLWALDLAWGACGPDLAGGLAPWHSSGPWSQGSLTPLRYNVYNGKILNNFMKLSGFQSCLNGIHFIGIYQMQSHSQTALVLVLWY